MDGHLSSLFSFTKPAVNSVVCWAKLNNIIIYVVMLPYGIPQCNLDAFLFNFPEPWLTAWTQVLSNLLENWQRAECCSCAKPEPVFIFSTFSEQDTLFSRSYPRFNYILYTMICHRIMTLPSYIHSFEIVQEVIARSSREISDVNYTDKRQSN